MPDDVARQIVLPVPLDEAWEAVTALEDWFAEEVELDPRPGGEATFRFEDGGVREAVVEDVEEPRRFAFRWRADDEDGERTAWREGGPGTRVEFTLDEVPQGTRVVVVESGWDRVAGPRMQALAAHAAALSYA